MRLVRMDEAPEGALIAFSACAAAGLALAVLIALAAVGHVAGLDTAVLVWTRAQTGETGPIVALAQGGTVLGNNTTLWIVTLVVAGYLLVGGRTRALIHLLGATGGGGLLTSTIKALVDRPRPAVVLRLVETNSASFPSGHAMNSAFVYGTLALLAARATRSKRERRYVLSAAIALSVMIGTSRVVLGVHWPSDVLAGWAIGALWAALASIAFGHTAVHWRSAPPER